jgi:hypothetical protein
VIAYHFTHPLHLPAILKAQRLTRTESNLSLRVAHAGPDVVWLTDCPEPGDGDDHGLYAEKRIVRFIVELPDSDVFRWVPWARRRGATRKTIETFNSTGGGLADHWLITTRDIPMDEWVALDILDGGRYRDIEEVIR